MLNTGQFHRYVRGNPVLGEVLVRWGVDEGSGSLWMDELNCSDALGWAKATWRNRACAVFF